MRKLLIFTILIISIIFISPAFATLHYVDSGATGADNGTSWTDAWPAFSNITGITAGDTVYISGGAVSKTYSVSTVTPIGTLGGTAITYKIGQASPHNGIATFNSSGSFVTKGDVIVSGDAGDGDMHFVFGTGLWISRQGATDNIRISYVDLGTRQYSFYCFEATGIEIDHCKIIKINTNGGEDTPFNLEVRGSLGDNSFHHNEVWIPRHPTSIGIGDDGIQGSAWGLDIYNNKFIGYEVEVYADSQHMDAIQMLAGGYIRIYNNEFIDIENYPIYMEAYCSGFSNLYIWNNLIRWETKSITDAAPPIGIVVTGKRAGNQISNVWVFNNDIIDIDEHNSIFFNNSNGDATFANCGAYNNVSVNGGSGMSLHANVDTDSNVNITAANAPNTFTSYVTNSSSNDFTLKSTDTTLTDQGCKTCGGDNADLTSISTTDFDGDARSATWDIGAYEGGVAGPDTTAPVVSGGFPSTEQDCTSSPRSVTIGVTATDSSPPIVCHYDTSDVAYASMAGTLGTIVGYVQSQVITDLACDSTQTFYVRCTDDESNVNTSSTTITFDIDIEGIPSECSGDDEFTGSNDDPPVASRWINNGSKIDTNRLKVFDTAADGAGDARSSWTTTGNTEVQVDFDVTGYSESNGWRAELGLYVDDDNYFSIAIEYNGDTYRFLRTRKDDGDMSWATASATNSTGSLKINRASNSFTVYYRDGTGAWTVLGETLTVGSANDEMYAYLGAPSWNNEPDITAYMDNFQFNSGCVDDEPDILTTSPSTEQECTPADPIDADIVVTTNEICECKKCVDGVGDCDADSVFNDAEMVAFTTTDAKTHTETDSLSCDQTIKYRIICEDPGNVEMTANEDFSFFVASGGADSTPPVMSDLSPASTPNLTCITSSPRDVTASLKTNEIGTCKYSLDGDGGDDENTAYDDLNNTFSTTGGVTHSQLLSLACGASYTYWVRCQDDEETPNQNVASGEITFIINDAPPPPSTKGLTLTGTGVSGGGLE